jgi:hypothetical protein
MNNPIKHINILDDVFKKRELDKIEWLKIPLFRGINGNKRLKGLKNGQVFTFREFLSTSISPSVAFDFQGCGEKACCILIFHIDDKIPYIPLYWDLKPSKYMSSSDEHEILLPRSTSWKLIDKYKVAMDFDNSTKCSYKNITKSVKRKITVYEFQGLDYVLPETPLKTLEKNHIDRYSWNVKKNKIPFLIMNDIHLDQLDKDLAEEKAREEKAKAKEEKAKAKEEKAKAKEEKAKAKEEKAKAKTKSTSNV